MTPRSRETLGLVVVLLVAGVSALVFTGVLQGTLAGGGETVRARFDDTGRLEKGDPVRVEGVRVGRVAGVDLDEGGRSATVELEVLDDALPVFADARAVIRWRTVLGGAYAVDLERGSPSAGELAGVIPVARTDNQVELDDVLTTFRARELAGLKTLLSELPDALGDPDTTGRLLDDLAGASPTVTRAVDAVRGSRDGDITRLVASTSRTVRALDGRDEPLRDVVEGAATTLRTTAAREADLRATLTRGARVMPQARATLARLDRTLDGLDPLVAELQEPAGEIAPAVDDLRPVLGDADRLLDRARPLLRTLRPAVSSLARASRTGAPLLESLTPSVRRLDDRILPRLAVPDPVSGRPTFQMIGPTFAGLTSVAGRFDKGGHVVKLSAQFGERPIQTLPCTTYLTDPTRQDLVSCELLTKAFGDLFGVTP